MASASIGGRTSCDKTKMWKLGLTGLLSAFGAVSLCICNLATSSREHHKPAAA